MHRGTLESGIRSFLSAAWLDGAPPDLKVSHASGNTLLGPTRRRRFTISSVSVLRGLGAVVPRLDFHSNFESSGLVFESGKDSLVFVSIENRYRPERSHTV